MRRRSTVGGALEMFSLPLPLPIKEVNVFARVRLSICQSVCLLADYSKKRAWIWIKCCVSTDIDVDDTID